eukprot:1181864-Prorocentrum_minimum.AAC.6
MAHVDVSMGRMRPEVTSHSLMRVATWWYFLTMYQVSAHAQGDVVIVDVIRYTCCSYAHRTRHGAILEPLHASSSTRQS